MEVETVVVELAVAEVVAVTEEIVAAEVVMVADTEVQLHEKVVAEMIVQETIDHERIVLLHQDHMLLEMAHQVHHEVMRQEQIADLQGLHEVTSNQVEAQGVKQVVKQDALLEVVEAVVVAREDASLLNDGVRVSRLHTPLF